MSALCLYRRARWLAMAPIFGPPVGTPRSGHLKKAALAVLETQWRTPYYYDLFKGDVGHTLVLGATGAGKSFALNFLLVQALQYDPRVLILDLGGSYRWLTQFLGGGYMELSPDSGTRGAGFPLAALLAPGGGADLRIPYRVDIAALADRRMDDSAGKTLARFAPASKTSTLSRPVAGPLGCWFAHFLQRCGPLWAAGMARERGPNTSIMRRMVTILTSRTGR